MSLWPHQLRAAEWLAARQYGVLDCPMGGGKTATAIHAAKMAGAKRVLVATRSANMGDWPVEIGRVWPEAPALVLDSGTGAKKGEKALRWWGQQDGWIVTNHEAIWRAPLSLIADQADLVIIDECHKLKSPTGKFSRWAFKALARKRRWGLTGTLLPHSPLDAYGIGRALGGGAVGGSYVWFVARHAIMGGFEGQQFIGLKDHAAFAQMLERWVHKVNFEDMRGSYELPPAVHVTRRFALSIEGRRAYDAVQEGVVEDVLGGRITMQNGAIQLLRLQQATGGHLPVDGLSRVVCTAKLDALRDVLEEELPAEPVVVFFRFTAEISEARRMLAGMGRPCFEISGRCDEHRLWKETGHANAVLLAQIQSASEGISLVRGRAAVYYSLGFELAQYEQSLKRIHRPGQDKPVVYVHLVAEGTVDEVVYGALAKRKRVVEEVLSHLTKSQNARRNHAAG